nr:MAG TPA: hypothetical protein [Caudoviricetes sp.]
MKKSYPQIAQRKFYSSQKLQCVKLRCVKLRCVKLGTNKY